MYGQTLYTEMQSQDVRALIESHAEGTYSLIDVRERPEYDAAHIPGAKLIPMSELEQRIDEIPSDGPTIFYCRSGARSGRVAGFVAATRGLEDVINLSGGIMAWQGKTLADAPRLAALGSLGDVVETLHRAIDLEKGAERFYTAVAAGVNNPAIRTVIDRMAEAEEDHARHVYDQLASTTGDALPPFDTLYSELPGELLESGESYDAVVARANELALHGEAGLLELALDMEFRAYDLYRALAHESDDAQLAEAMLGLAEQEKRHAGVLLTAIGDLAAAAA